MPKVLKYAGKGQWLEIDEERVIASDRTKPIIRTKHTKASRLDLFFDALSSDIQKNGYRTIKLTTLLQNFGIGKRTAKNVLVVKEQLKQKGFYTLPEFSQELKLESSLRIYNYPVRQLGDLFPSEKHLEDFVAEYKLYTELNIDSVERQHSPQGTKDKLDFKGACSNDEVVVLELKNGGGGKSAVEQVLRYAGLLKMEFPNKTIRPILVTGIQNYETALAIRGMQSEQRELFEWYLYDYRKDAEQLSFLRVTKEDIEYQTNSVV